MNATLGGRMDESEMRAILEQSDETILGRLVKNPNGKVDPNYLCAKFQQLLANVYGDEGLTAGRQSLRVPESETDAEVTDLRLKVIQRVRQAVQSINSSETSTQVIDSYLSIGDGDSAYKLIQQLEGEQLEKYRAKLNSRLPLLQFSPELHEKIVGGKDANPLISVARMLLVMAYPEKFVNGLTGGQEVTPTGIDTYKIALWTAVFNANIEDQTLKTIIELAKTLSNGTAALLELINRANINFECEAELLNMARAQTSSDKVFTKWVFENMKGSSGRKTLRTKKDEVVTILVDNTATIVGHSPKGVRNMHISKQPATKQQ